MTAPFRSRLCFKPFVTKIFVFTLFPAFILLSRLKVTPSAWALFLGIACLGTIDFAPSAWAEPIVKGKYGDWTLQCDTPPGASKEQCALTQSVTPEDRPNNNLIVVVLKTADGKNRLLRVLTPLGVILPNGLGLRIDQTHVGRTGFVKCLQNACVAEVILDDKLIDQLKTGKTATFIIYMTPEEGTGFPITLTGFADAYAALQ